MSNLSIAEDRGLAVRLFVPCQRCGWEFRAPTPVSRSPLASSGPVWVEPPTPAEEVRLARRVKRTPMATAVGIAASGWVTVWAVAWGFPLWMWVLPAGVALSIGWCVISRVSLTRHRRRFELWRTQEHARYVSAHRQWAELVATHDRAELRRVESAVLWHPIGVDSQAGRVDVFGGTTHGWSSLLATFGSSLLAGAAGALVVDFTEQHVADGLVALARSAGYAVRGVEFPDAAAGMSLLHGLTPEEVGDVVSTGLAAIRSGEQPTGQRRGLDAELVEMVAEALRPRITFARLVAGLRLLRRVYDAERESVLSAVEIRRINTLLDTVGATDPAREELRFLTATLGLLADDGSEAGRYPVQWPQDGLTVISTAATNTRRKELTDQLVFHRVLHAVRTGHRSATTSVLIVAGIDDLGLGAVEALARQARRAGVRLVVMAEHLRGELTQLLGGADSASILMRMGNAAEAAAAADFVGRGYRFTLSQYSVQVGRTVTDGASDSHSDSVTTSSSDSFAGNSASTSDSTSRGQSWSQTTSWSTADSTSTGHTMARGYEYVMDPTTFQSLPPTAFVLVDTTGNARRIVAGDCEPEIAVHEPAAGPHPGGNR